MFRKKFVPSLPPEWIIVGLGNPGPEYRGTRHNVGFDVIDLLSEKHRCKLDKAKHRAKYGIGEISGVTVALVKPLTYMNASGQAIAPLARELQIAPMRILVIADDLDLTVGRTRLKPSGSSGGHNGHKSLISGLGTENYPRLKIGIGSVSRSDTVDHVLGSFTPAERDLIGDSLTRAVLGVEAILRFGIEAAMNVVNVG